MDDKVLFRSTVTGKTGLYPARFESRPTFERIDPSEDICVDCWMKPEDVDDDELTDIETDTFGLTHSVLDEDESEDN